MRNGLFSWLCKYSIVPLIKFFFIKEIRGWENFSTERNFILVSNHLSYIDVLIDGSLCVPKRFHFIGQVDSWKGIAGFFVKLYYLMAGVIPLDRKSEESRKAVTQKAIELLKKGEILIIYPEGTRSKNGKLQEGKLGVAKIFLETGVPILPVGIKGTFELMPPHGKPKIKKEVKVNIGKPLFFEEELKEAKNLDKSSKDYIEILQKVTDKIMKEISNLTANL